MMHKTHAQKNIICKNCKHFVPQKVCVAVLISKLLGKDISPSKFSDFPPPLRMLRNVINYALYFTLQIHLFAPPPILLSYRCVHTNSQVA